MSTNVFPFAVWLSGTNQNSIPANDNALRVEVITGPALSILSAQPLTPSDGDQYILGAAPTGEQWATFVEGDVVIFKGGTWLAFAPYEGWMKFNEDDGETYQWNGTWAVFAGGGGGGGIVESIVAGTGITVDNTDPANPVISASGGGGGGTIGKHMVPIMAGAMRPSVTGGCAPLAGIASASNQPDIVTLDFDATTVEYAQFAIPMPSSWDEGTLTFRPIWSHASGSGDVVWELQAVAVSDDDTILANFGAVQSVTDPGGTVNDVYIGAESSAITVGGTPAAGDLVFFRMSRNASAVGDTLAVDARLHGIMLFMTTDAEVDT